MPDKTQSSGPVEPDILRYHVPPRLKFYGVVALIAAVIIVVWGLGLRFYSSIQTKNWTEDQAIPTVEIVQLKGAASGGALDLPGDVQAFTNAPIQAQVSGTILKWYVDIGAPVKAGQILAQIDPRSFEAALTQAKGQLVRDAATLDNAKVDLARYQALAAQNAISNMVLSAQATTVSADTGVVQTDQAAVQNAAINLGYTQITAPFDGIVTSRSVDTGNFVTVGTATTTPLFTVTDLSKLRIYVRMPQNYLQGIRPGMSVNFTVPEYAGRIFTAQFVAAAGAVTSGSGTQLLQFQTDNKDGAIKPGSYATMHFKFPAAKGVVRVPATALLFRPEGMVAATVDANNHVKLKTIGVRTDLGDSIEATGLTFADRVIDNPSDSFRDGDPVRPEQEKQARASAAGE